MKHVHRTLQWSIEAAIAIMISSVLASCGGGGGGGAGSLSLSFSPSPLTASIPVGGLPTTVSVTATVSGSTSASTVYVLISDPGATFSNGQVGISQSGPDSYIAYLPIGTGTAVGDHTGTLQVRLCGDPNCGTVLGSAGLPYNINIVPPTVSSVSSPAQISAIQDAAGSLPLSVTATSATGTVYTRVRDGGGVFVNGQSVLLAVPPGFLGGYNISDNAVLSVVPGLTASAYAGTLLLDVCSDQSCSTTYYTLTVPFSAQILAVLAGQPGYPGNVDGAGISASFNTPYDIALDANGNLFVADYGNSEVRKVAPDGTVSTYPNAMQLTPTPQSIGVDATGDVFYSKNTEAPGNGPSKIAPDGTITQFGINFILLLEDPAGGIAFDAAGNVYTTETSHAYIDKYDPTGLTHNRISSSLLSSPVGIIVDASGHLYVCDTAIVKIDASLNSTTLASPGFRSWYGALDSSNNLYVTNLSGVYQVTQTGGVSTAVAPGAVYSNGSTFSPLGVALTSGRLLLLSDNVNHVILETTLP